MKQSERKPSERYREWLLGLAIVRIILAVVAIPLAPFLYREHFLILVLLRPTKEVFLAGGFLARQGDVNLLQILIAAVPLSILGVWNFYGLGKGYAKEIDSDDLPPLADRIITPKRIKKFDKALDRKGPRLIFLGRMAAMSSATIAAAAGATKMPAREFLPADGLGGAASFALATGAGYLLGAAHEEAGPWLTGLAAVALIGFAFVLGRQLQRA
ncbi:MAG: VTT domain-containing protein [Actinomycetota bacterium]|nr:VTT domain-containing protein [Actinomycetota bacterium]